MSFAGLSLPQVRAVRRMPPRSQPKIRYNGYRLDINISLGKGTRSRRCARRPANYRRWADGFLPTACLFERSTNRQVGQERYRGHLMDGLITSRISGLLTSAPLRTGSYVRRGEHISPNYRSSAGVSRCHLSSPTSEQARRVAIAHKISLRRFICQRHQL